MRTRYAGYSRGYNSHISQSPGNVTRVNLFPVILMGFSILGGAILGSYLHRDDFDLGFQAGAARMKERWADYVHAQETMLKGPGGLCKYADSACGYFHNPHPAKKTSSVYGYKPKPK